MEQSPPLSITRGANSSVLLAFALGIIAGYLVPKIYRLIVASKYTYALDHALLNLQLPPPTMWMNMGWWDTTTSTLPEASENLLRRLLQAADIPTGSRILDLGFGCGDQSLVLQRSFEYSGITLSSVQFDTAQRRLPHGSDIFCGDAARPEMWPDKLVQKTGESTDWVLALDCMYHFRPSREGTVRVAGQKLQAGLAAFDLFRAQDVSRWQMALLRVVCWMADLPWANMCTAEEYRDMLVKVGGYADVEIEDISANVYAGLAGFIKKRDRDLKDIGVSGGVGRYTGAAKLFGWLGTTGLIRACLVVARKGSKK